MTHAAHAPPSRAEFVIVLMGGLALAASAGYVNTAVIAMGSLPVTHLTGSISRVSSDLGRLDLADAVQVSGLVLAFVLGAAISGVIIGSATLHLGRRYGIAVMFEAVLLAAAAAMAPRSLNAAAVLAASAAGLQNAMAASYRALIIRTTHVTGILTDLGFQIGQLFSGHSIAGWKFALLGSLLVAFVAGGVAGAVAQERMGTASLWVPAVGMALGGAGYFAWRVRSHMVRQHHHGGEDAEKS